MRTIQMLLRDAEHTINEITEEVASWQSLDDGGWAVDPRTSNTPPDTDTWTTAQVALWLMQYDPARFGENIDRAVQYLAEAQHAETDEGVQPDGGWGWKRRDESESTATSLALRALTRYAQLHRQDPTKYQEYVDTMVAGRNWIMRHVNHDGGFVFAAYENDAIAYNTCWCTIALQECTRVPELYQPGIEVAIIPAVLHLIEAHHVPHGWGNVIKQSADATGVAYCIYLLHSLQHSEQTKAGIRWLKSKQQDDGSWSPAQGPSAIEPTAWAVIALLASGDDPQTYRLQAAISYLLDAYVPKRGWPMRPKGEAKVWTSYYAYLALHAFHYQATRRGISSAP